MVRKAAVAGRFYEEDPARLREQVQECFTHEMGPGGLPDALGVNEAASPVLAGIVPHAGLMFSGMCAAHLYRKVAETVQDPVFLILGVNHTGLGLGKTSLMKSDWETPLGICKVEEGLASCLLEQGMEEDSTSHRHEHSIEVQLPFLQVLWGEKARFVPVMVNTNEGEEKIAQDLAKSILAFERSSGKKVVMLASADLTHFGPDYGYVPFGERVKEQLRELDMATITTVLKRDPDTFIGHLRKTKATVCGALTIPCLLRTLDALEKEGKQVSSGKLLSYYTSGDILGDYTNAVSYASIVFSLEKVEVE